MSWNDAYLPPSRLAPGNESEDLPSGSQDARPASSATLNSAPAAISGAGKRFVQGEIPCARSSLLMGIVTGVGFTGIGVFAGRPIRSAANWGVLGFTVVSIVNWNLCNSAAASERQRMRTVVENYQQRKATLPSGAAPVTATATKEGSSSSQAASVPSSSPPSTSILHRESPSPSSVPSTERGGSGWWGRLFGRGSNQATGDDGFRGSSTPIGAAS